MSWKTILKIDLEEAKRLGRKHAPEDNPTKEEMLKELWQMWKGQLETYLEYNFENYWFAGDTHGTDHYRSFNAITDRLLSADIINNRTIINRNIGKLSDHPQMPMETLDYPMTMDDAEEDIRRKWLKMKNEE
tara:strand:+ start:71 stop:466 length:396 start_codon:yes stop_codon:yes gene_type:complete